MKLTFEETENQLSESDIAAFEQEFGLVLPAEYKAHLLRFNGGIPNKEIFPIKGDDEIFISCFYSLKWGDARIEDTVRSLKVEDVVLPADLLPIADDGGGNQICIAVSGPDTGAVYIWYHDEEGEVRKLAPSLGEFLKKLRDE